MCIFLLTCLHCIPPPAAFLKALFSVPYFLSCTPLLLVLLYPPFPWTTTSMQMTQLFLSFSSSRLWLQHYSPSEFSSSDLFLDDCQPSNAKLLQGWIPSDWTHQTTCQNPQLLAKHHPLCSQPGLHLWWTQHFQIKFPQFPNLAITIFVSFDASAPTSIPKQLLPLPLHRSFQTWLL